MAPKRVRKSRASRKHLAVSRAEVQPIINLEDEMVENSRPTDLNYIVCAIRSQLKKIRIVLSNMRKFIINCCSKESAIILLNCLAEMENKTNDLITLIECQFTKYEHLSEKRRHGIII